MTFCPLLDVYTTKMVDPLIPLPVPIATQELLVGAVICRNISPVPEEEVASGMFML